MDTLSTTLFLHFVGMVALFIGYGLEWTASTLLRRCTTGDQARAWLRIYRASLPVSGPGLLLLIVTGGYLASRTGGMKQAWISATLLGIVVAVVIGFGLLLPRFKALRAALPEGNASLGAGALTRVQDPLIVTLIRARAVLALGIVYLMTAKPVTMGAALLILLAAIIAGALCAATSWSRTKTAK